ncbi:MAG: A24 family peptidase [Pseudomonadota bacterium]
MTLSLDSIPLGVFVAYIFIVGLMVGSFLNVVIYRLPKMLYQSWNDEAIAFLQAESTAQVAETLTPVDENRPTFNLAYPPSRCGHCGHRLKWYENIPLVSWCLQKAKCRACGGKISIRYPLVECLTGITSAYIAYRYGFSYQTAAAFLLNAVLICAFWIDWDTQLLPDDLMLPLIWAGLIINYLGVGFVPFSEAFWGAISGYLILWSVYWLFYLCFKKEGMGYGDFKLLSALGAWLGWLALPSILLIASLSGLLYGGVRALTGFRSPSEQVEAETASTQESKEAEEGHQWSRPLPFGPFLIVGGWIVWMAYPEAAHLFLHP